MEIKINKSEFDLVMKNLNASIANFTDADNKTMDDMITVWSGGETDAPAFNKYLQRLIGANSLMTNYYHDLLVSNSEAISKIGEEYLKLDDSAANDFDANTSLNYLYGLGGTAQPPFPNGGSPSQPTFPTGGNIPGQSPFQVGDAPAKPQGNSPLFDALQQNGVTP